MNLIYLTEETLKTIGLTEEERHTVEHFKRVLGKREILPMVHPTEVDKAGLPLVCSTIIPPRTTRVIEDMITSIRTIAGKILQANSNWCQCARQYNTLENGKTEWLKRWVDGDADPETGQPVSKTRLERKLEEIDRMIHQLFPNTIPPQWAINAHDAPCEYCGKPRLINQAMAFSEPAFVRNMLNVFLGGEFPLEATSLFVEYLDRTIFNEDVIPPAKKKRVTEVEKKIQIKALKDKVLSWIGRKLTMLEQEEEAMHQKKMLLLSQPPKTTIEPEVMQQAVEEYLTPLKEKIETIVQALRTNSPPNTSADSTNIMDENGDGPQMTLTKDFLPVNETSITNKASKPGEKSPMS